MPGQHIGSLIAAAFGLVYVEVNARSLPGEATWTLRVLALVLLLATVVLALRTRRLMAASDDPVVPGGGAGSGPAPFGARYWAIVVVEFALIFAGVRVLSGPLERPYAGVAWVSLVVGLHFFVLARHFRVAFFTLLDYVITACGGVGLALALATASPAIVAVVAGVVPGFVLLGSAAWGVSRRAPATPGLEPVPAHDHRP